MYTEILNGMRTMSDIKVSIEKDLGSILKEFHFDEVSNQKWRLGEFVIYLNHLGDDNLPHIHLYHGNTLLAHYYTFYHRLWWYLHLGRNLTKIDTDREVINDIMNHIRNKWINEK
jgi:hypothetical protein